MHKDDQMTPKERAFALFAGKPVDRMPIKLFSPYIGMNTTFKIYFVTAPTKSPAPGTYNFPNPCKEPESV